MLAPDDLRLLLCDLGCSVRYRLLETRSGNDADISYVSTADTIYEIDRVSEKAISDWFESHWPADEPVQIVMEGIEDDQPLCFPRDLPVEQTRWKCLLDPIDGTRCLMHDKRSAWVLGGVAPQRGPQTRLSDIVAAAMTELPTSKQWRADQLSAVKGGGVQAGSVNILNGEHLPFSPQSSQARDFQHGFSWFAKYFPEGRTLTSQIEEQLWEKLADGESHGLAIFDDQYLSTGGAFYELLAGHDRMSGDLRPLVFARLGLEEAMVCHPYDVAAALILTEAGIIYEHPLGGFPDAPLDTTTPIAWVGFANTTLAEKARPVLQKVLHQFLA